jgi:putative transcriptional regulator
MDILQNKNLTSRFQILVEIASTQPNVQQRNIARNLGITPQAVSEYIRQLSADGMVATQGRSRHSVTPKGIDWMIRQLNEVKEYFISVERIIWNIRITAAMADSDIKNGQTVGLVMRQGLLLAVEKPGNNATGLAVTDARKGDVVGITEIHGIIQMEKGEVAIIEVPGIQKGKTQSLNLEKVRKIINGRQPVAYLGLEALAVLNSLNIKPDIYYAGDKAVIEAVRKGVSPVLVCVDEQLTVLINQLTDNSIPYRTYTSDQL